MTSIQITSKIDFDQLIAGLAQLEASELEKCIEQARLLLAKRRQVVVSDEESRLLAQINQELPTGIASRHSLLKGKLQAQTITPAENSEFQELTEQIEKADMIRLKALINLSQLRQTSLSQLMDALNAVPPSVELSMSSAEKAENPWLKFSGVFKDDPDFEEIVREIQASREEAL